IAKLGQKIVDLYYNVDGRPKGKGVNVSISVSTFVPKPFTPFEFCAQISKEEMRRRQQLLRDSITTKKISLSWHDSDTSSLEGALARGDRRTGKVIETAFNMGAKMDGWGEAFNYELWLEAFEKSGLSPEFYANRERSTDEINPWDHLDYGVSKEFLVREYSKALCAATTPNCREKCANCGANKYGRGVCFEKR
ncbi:MAG: B12-binding domain-containing radical SAM protein, partial [Clostridia bacterium]|nr:B12-binding domain-containing radical SAM protein [Clostridia bacterium]